VVSSQMQMIVTYIGQIWLQKDYVTPQLLLIMSPDEERSEAANEDSILIANQQNLCIRFCRCNMMILLVLYNGVIGGSPIG